MRKGIARTATTGRLGDGLGAGNSRRDPRGSEGLSAFFRR